MSLKRNVRFSVMFGSFILAACATTPEQQAARAEVQALRRAEISARRGEYVSQICPRGSDSWRAFDDDILLLEARGEWYMAELLGTCDPDSAFGAIVTRGGTVSACVARGDDIFTGRPRSGGRCVITALYRWNEDGEAEAPGRASPAETSAAPGLRDPVQ